VQEIAGSPLQVHDLQIMIVPKTSVTSPVQGAGDTQQCL